MNQPLSVVDAHVHLGPPKYATVEQFTAAMEFERIDGAVLVQHLGNSDNRYLAAIRRARPQRFAAVAIIDRVDEVEATLRDGFVGLRLPPTGLPGRDGADVFAALDQAQALASITGPASAVASAPFAAIVRQHPRVQFRIEHLGGYRYGATAEDQRQFTALLALADQPNVTLMWSGFFLNAGTPFPYPNTHAYLAATHAAFGADRIMWSGDWNRPGLATGDYHQMIELVRLVTADEDDVEAILVGTARRVFGIHPEIEDPHV